MKFVPKKYVTGRNALIVVVIIVIITLYALWKYNKNKNRDVILTMYDQDNEEDTEGGVVPDEQLCRQYSSNLAEELKLNFFENIWGKNVDWELLRDTSVQKSVNLVRIAELYSQETGTKIWNDLRILENTIWQFLNFRSRKYMILLRERYENLGFID
jgi:hypothetical protein